MRLSFLLILAVLSFHAVAQVDPSGPELDMDSSRSLVSYFKAGKMEGNFRYYFMATDNEPGLTDYYANAIGGGLRFETAPFHGFQLGLAGFYIFNIGSSDLTAKDPKTDHLSRYEIGQFNILDLANKDNMDRLEAFFLKYSIGKTTLVAGHQNLKSPFINPQDGRMRPTAESGLWIESLGDIKNTELRFGFLNAISPRGTLEWLSMGESIGLYPSGVNVNGEKSMVLGQIQSDKVLLFNASHTFKRKVVVQAWNQWAENIFNTILVQADGVFPISNEWNWVTGIQVIRQDAIANGGNANQSLTYAPRGWKSTVFGGKLGVKKKNFETNFSYTRITKEGRFLMPREWGREPLFTYMARERNEGAGDVHAFVYRISNQIPNGRLRPEISLGYYRMPDVKNYRLNKYAMPSYWQINASIKHEFSGFMNGLDAEILAVYKGKAGETYGNLNSVFNKVNMFHLNAILNYHF